MRNIALHVDASTIVNIVHLRGELIGTSPTKPPVFDDPTSFKVHVDSAEISLDAKALTQLLNRYTFVVQGLAPAGRRGDGTGSRVEGLGGTSQRHSGAVLDDRGPERRGRTTPTASHERQSARYPDEAPDGAIRPRAGQPDQASRGSRRAHRRRRLPAESGRAAAAADHRRTPSVGQRRRRPHRAAVRPWPPARAEAARSVGRQLHVLLRRRHSSSAS